MSKLEITTITVKRNKNIIDEIAYIHYKFTAKNYGKKPAYILLSANDYFSLMAFLGPYFVPDSRISTEDCFVMGMKVIIKKSGGPELGFNPQQASDFVIGVLGNE